MSVNMERRHTPLKASRALLMGALLTLAAFLAGSRSASRTCSMAPNAPANPAPASAAALIAPASDMAALQEPVPPKQAQQAQPLDAGRWGPEAANATLEMSLPSWALAGRAYSDLQDMPESVDPFNVYPKMHSQEGEDRWLWENIFYRKTGGFFLEMGALDGVYLSNTKWLESAAGWRGLLIEATPARAADLFRNRPNAICVHAAACSQFATVHWATAGGQSWQHAMNGIWEFMNESFKQKWYKNITPEQVAAFPAIQCLPLQYILDRLGITHIDLFSLDVEGAELEVLRTLDFSRVTINTIVAELDGKSPEKDEVVRQLLTDAGFELVRKAGRNEFWAASEFVGKFSSKTKPTAAATD